MSDGPMTATIRQAIRDSGETVYAIAIAAGLEPASLRRFMAGERSLRLDMADRLATYLALELLSKTRKRSK